MLNKFELPEGDVAPGDPRLVLAEAWAEFIWVYAERHDQISTALNGVMISRLKRRQNQQTTKAVELEARLQQFAPEFVVATGGLKRALDNVNGWSIRWRHYERGEVIGHEIVAEEGDAIFAQTVRELSQYHLNDGRIVGSRVGVDVTYGGIGAWVEIAPNNAPRGMNIQLAEMFAIEIIPTGQAESPR